MEQKHGGLMKFLNDETQNHMRDLPVQRIEIERIDTNPNNFYGMREVDQLAGMIAMSNFVEPLVVRKAPEGRYMLVAGHRRLAAWKKLLESGEVTDKTLPCYVREFKDMTITHADGTVETFKAEQLEFFYLMLSNRGQRQERTVEEQLREIRELEPLAKAIWKQKSEDNEYQGNFRKYFAEEVLTISPAKLQRKLALANLTPKALKALEEGKISETAAVKISKIDPNKQDEYIDDILAGRASAKISNIQDEIDRRDNGCEEELDDSEVEEAEDEEELDDSEVEEAEAEETKDVEVTDNFAIENADGMDSSEDTGTEERHDGETSYDSGEVSNELHEHKDQPSDESHESHPSPSNRTITLKTDVPIDPNIENPHAEGNEFVINALTPAFEALIQSTEEAKQIAENNGDEVAALQWGIRLSVSKIKVAQLRQPV